MIRNIVRAALIAVGLSAGAAPTGIPISAEINTAKTETFRDNSTIAHSSASPFRMRESAELNSDANPCILFHFFCMSYEMRLIS